MADDLDAVRAYYDGGGERERLATGVPQLERARTLELLERHLPAPPATVADVGAGAGSYAIELARRGYAVYARDLSPTLVAAARRDADAAGVALASCEVADARALTLADASADAVLLLGPLYHLIDAGDRGTALAEAARVVRPGGPVLVAAIARWAPVVDGLRLGLMADPAHLRALDEVARSGRFHPAPASGFTVAYFHTPDGLRDELVAADLHVAEIVGIEGSGWALGDFDERWADPARRAELLDAARRLEGEEHALGASLHLMAIARRA